MAAALPGPQCHIAWQLYLGLQINTRSSDELDEHYTLQDCSRFCFSTCLFLWCMSSFMPLCLVWSTLHQVSLAAVLQSSMIRTRKGFQKLDNSVPKFVAQGFYTDNKWATNKVLMGGVDCSLPPTLPQPRPHHESWDQRQSYWRGKRQAPVASVWLRKDFSQGSWPL